MRKKGGGDLFFFNFSIFLILQIKYSNSSFPFVSFTSSPSLFHEKNCQSSMKK